MATDGDTTRQDFVIHLTGLGALLTCAHAALGSMPSGQTTLPNRPIPGTEETPPIVGFGSAKPALELPTEGTEPVAGGIRTLLEHGERVADTSRCTSDVNEEFGTVLAALEFSGRLFRRHEDQHG